MVFSSSPARRSGVTDPPMLYLSAVPAELGNLPGFAVGVGPFEALLGTDAILRAHSPSLVVFVGSAGSFGADVPGTVIEAGQVTLGDAAALLGLGYTPRPAPAFALPGTTRVITNAAITTSPDLAARYALAADVEHMEAWSVAYVCARHAIPCRILLGIANRVGPDAHAEWLAHRSLAEDAARRAARALGR